VDLLYARSLKFEIETLLGLGLGSRDGGGGKAGGAGYIPLGSIGAPGGRILTRRVLSWISSRV
jgi:hypothetical protein